MVGDSSRDAAVEFAGGGIGVTDGEEEFAE